MATGKTQWAMVSKNKSGVKEMESSNYSLSSKGGWGWSV